MSITPGQLLGKYRILERLGEGGMGAVHHARDEMLDRDVAIKVLRPELVAREELVARFRTEAVALARLAHPRIATLYGLERADDELYMVMEYLSGETLEALVTRERRLPWRKAARICAAVAEALDHAHDHGVVHRDIKPANIMIGPGGSIKVMDFGIARMAGSSRQTKHGHTVGTPAYMAPEQLRGQETDGRTDLYSLGAVLYELVTGQIAFEADSDYRLMMQQLNEPPPRPSSVVPGLPTEIDGIVLTAMEKSRDDRFATASAMRVALLEAANDPTLPAAPIGETGEQVPATRFAAALPTTGTTEPTRRDDPPARGAAGSTAPGKRSSPQRPFWLDWRSWATVAMAVAAVGLLVRSGNGPESNPIEPAIIIDSMPIDPGTSVTDTNTAGTDRKANLPGGGGYLPQRPSPIIQPDPLPPVNRSRSPRPEPTPPPAPPPPPPSPVPTPAPEQTTDPAVDRQQVDRAVAAWLGRLESRDPGGATGTINGQQFAKLVRSGRVGVESRQTTTIDLDADRARATVRATLAVRSSFGAARKEQVRFRFELARNGEVWRVGSVVVEG